MKASIKAGFGISSAESTKNAVQEAVTSAMEKLGEEEENGNKNPSIAFVSTTVARNIEEIQSEFVNTLPKNTPIHGITSSGSILIPGEGAKNAAVACLLLQCGDGNGDDDDAFVTAYDAADASAAVSALQEKLQGSSSSSSSPPKAILMGATPGVEEDVISLLDKAFPNIPVFGGTAADDELSGSWKVMSSEGSSSTGISLVAISSKVDFFGASMIGPYTPTSTTVVATKTDGKRRVYEINNAPAADWVYEWLGDEVLDQYKNGGLILPQTAQRPIGIRQGSGDGDDDEYVTNHLAAFGPSEEKYVDFFAPIPEGSILTIMDSGNGPSTGYSSALLTAYEMAKSSSSSSSSQPTAGLLVFCGGMAIAVGDAMDQGLTNEEFSSAVGTMPVLGMTCFGEQACLPVSKKNVQRNLSVGMILFG